MINVKLVSGALGGAVSGVDLNLVLSDESMEEIRQALLEYEVLFFKDQNLSPKAHTRFAAWFGSPGRWYDKGIFI